MINHLELSAILASALVSPAIVWALYGSYRLVRRGMG